MNRDEGILAGLKLSFFFLLGFVLIGTPVLPSIVLSGIAGYCLALIINWRLTKEKVTESWNNKLEKMLGTTTGKLSITEAQTRARTKLKKVRQKQAAQRVSRIRSLAFWRRNE